MHASICQSLLPFGGVNSSGLGKNGGKYGFLEFSNAKSVLIQMSGFSIAKLIYPPYSSLKQKITKCYAELISLEFL